MVLQQYLSPPVEIIDATAWGALKYIAGTAITLGSAAFIWCLRIVFGLAKDVVKIMGMIESISKNSDTSIQQTKDIKEELEAIKKIVNLHETEIRVIKSQLRV